MQDGMRSSGPLGSHMAARPHLASALSPLHRVQATAAEIKPMADGTTTDKGHIFALTPSAFTTLPHVGAGVTALSSPSQHGMAYYARQQKDQSSGSVHAF